MNNKLIERTKFLSEPNIKSSYSKKDCIFLLKDISGMITEISTEEKEELLNKGISYSETLTKESIPNREYVEMFKKGLENSKNAIAYFVAVMAETILKFKGKDVIFVSLARAGSPFGILAKDYIKKKYGINIIHYSISIIRGKGIDKNALCYIVNKHQNENIQFIDGWTGKGSITYELRDSINKFNEEFGTNLNSELAVVADPAGLSPFCGTREDIYIPNASLNSTVSGLISRTVAKDNLTGEFDFHGAKFYKDYIEFDFSNYFIEEIKSCLKGLLIKPSALRDRDTNDNGELAIEFVKTTYGINDKNKIKPSIGETSRVLLRRKAKFIIVKNKNDKDIEHLIYLANKKEVPVIEDKSINYKAIGVIE